MQFTQYFLSSDSDFLLLIGENSLPLTFSLCTSPPLSLSLYIISSMQFNYHSYTRFDSFVLIIAIESICGHHASARYRSRILLFIRKHAYTYRYIRITYVYACVVVMSTENFSLLMLRTLC